MVISMIVYTLIPFQGFGMKLLARIVLLPVITGLSYELIRFAAKRRGSFLALLTAPGLWLQRITTNRHPTSRPKWPSARSIAPWRSKPRRAASWSSPNSPWNTFGRLDQIEVRFDELTRQMADPAVISDAEQYRKIAKAHSELSEIVAKYREWKEASSQLGRRAPC